MTSPTPAATLFYEMEFGAQVTQCGPTIVGVYAGNESTHLLCGDGSIITMGFNRKGQAGVAVDADAVYPPQQVRAMIVLLPLGVFVLLVMSVECDVW